MKKIIYLLVFSFILCGCNKIQEGVDNSNSDEIVTDVSSEDTYRTIVSNEGTDIREVFSSAYQKDEQDYMKIGLGLQKICTEYFSTSSYYIKECEHMTYTIGTDDTGDYFQLMKRPESSEYSIQPSKTDVVDGKEGAVLFDMLYAVDFYTKSGSDYKLGGIAITAVIKADELDSETGITYTYSDNTINSYTVNAVNQIYNYYMNATSYDDLKNVPMIICIYKKASVTDDYSGGYIYQAKCADGKVGDCNKVNQKTYIFASDSANTADSTTSSEFTLFKSNLKSSAVDSVGVVGIGQYYDDKIYSLTIDVNMIAKVFDEYQAMSQYITQLLNDGAFSEGYEIKIRINNNTKTVGYVVKPKEEEASYYMLY